MYKEIIPYHYCSSPSIKEEERWKANEPIVIRLDIIREIVPKVNCPYVTLKVTEDCFDDIVVKSDEAEEIKNILLGDILEKQGEKKPQVYETEDGEIITYSEADGYKDVEPKFHSGQWITNGDCTWKIVEVKLLDYILQSQDGNIVDDTISYVDEHFHSFTIKDAKDGDVLAVEGYVEFQFPFVAIFKEKGADFFNSYCGIDMTGEFFIDETGHFTDEIHPATKEQRDILFQKMKEAGYEWNATKLALKENEQKPADKVEPKFKVGDWIICCDYEPYQIIDVKNGMYYWSNGDIRPIEMVDNNSNIHLWTIEDAKNGDVLVTNFEEDNMIVMYYSMCTIDTICVHCCLDNKKGRNNYFVCGNFGMFDVEDVKPATKEQRDLLFQKMKEAGYEWDADKKELKLLITNGGDFDTKNCEQKPVSITDEWIEDYWQHEKVNNPYSYDKGEEIQFDHQGFVRFCKKYCKSPAVWSEEDESIKGAIIDHLKDNNLTEWAVWLEKRDEQPEHGYLKTEYHCGKKPCWAIGDTLAFYATHSEEGECVLGKVTKVEFDHQEENDWVYTFEDGRAECEQTLLECATYKKN